MKTLKSSSKSTGLAGILAAAATSASAPGILCRRSGPASVVFRRCGSARRSSWPVVTARAWVSPVGGLPSIGGRRKRFDALPFQPLEHDPLEILVLESSHLLLNGGRAGAQQFQVLNDSRLLAHLFLDETGSMPTAAGYRRHRFADGDGPFRSSSTGSSSGSTEPFSSSSVLAPSIDPSLVSSPGPLPWGEVPSSLSTPLSNFQKLK